MRLRRSWPTNARNYRRLRWVFTILTRRTPPSMLVTLISLTHTDTLSQATSVLANVHCHRPLLCWQMYTVTGHFCVGKCTLSQATSVLANVHCHRPLLCWQMYTVTGHFYVGKCTLSQATSVLANVNCHRPLLCWQMYTVTGHFCVGKCKLIFVIVTQQLTLCSFFESLL